MQTDYNKFVTLSLFDRFFKGNVVIMLKRPYISFYQFLGV